MEQVKKGNRSWKPAQRLSLADVPKGFRPRWVENEPQNVEKKLAEGWVFADGLNGPDLEHDAPKEASGSKPLASGTTYRELVLMALPEEIGQARDEYHKGLTDRQEASIKQNLVKDAQRAGAPASAIHGKVVID